MKRILLSVLILSLFLATQTKGPAEEPSTPRNIPDSKLTELLPELELPVNEWIRNPEVITVRPGKNAIQKAVHRATPGTVITVRAGAYRECVDLSGVHGTPQRPILLISSDGPGEARVVGDNSCATFGAWGISNVGVYGFHIVAKTEHGDRGGVKIAGPWDEPARNVVFAGNLVSGHGQDGMKFFNGARNITVAGNIIAGEWRQECFDNVSVEKAIYAFNSTTPARSKYTSLTMKQASRDVEVIGNEFKADTSTQLSIGGFGDTSGRTLPEYWRTNFMARNVNVRHNVIGGASSIMFAGGQDSTVRNNQLLGRVSSSNGGEQGRRNMPSKNNTVTDNNGVSGSVGVSALPTDLLDLRPGGGLRRKTDEKDNQR